MEKMLLKPSRVVFHRCVVGGCGCGWVGGCGCVSMWVWVCGYVGGYVGV